MSDSGVRELIAQAGNAAAEYEASYHGCAQCTLLAVQRALSLESEDTFRATTGLSAGIGCLGMTCGALTGGVIAIGLAVGRGTSDLGTSSKVHWENYRLVKDLVARFRAKYGADLSCRAIQRLVLGRPFDLWNPADQQAFREIGARELGCSAVTKSAAEWTAEIILAHTQARGAI